MVTTRAQAKKKMIEDATKFEVDCQCYQNKRKSNSVCWLIPDWRAPEVLQNIFVASCPTLTLEMLRRSLVSIDDKTITQIVKWSIDAFFADVIQLSGIYERSFIRLRGWKKGECSCWYGKRLATKRKK